MDLPFKFVRLLLILKKRKKLFKFFFKICFGSKGLPAITAFNKRITTIIPAVPEDKLKEASRFVAIIRKQRLKLKKKKKKCPIVVYEVFNLHLNILGPRFLVFILKNSKVMMKHRNKNTRRSLEVQ